MKRNLVRSVLALGVFAGCLLCVPRAAAAELPKVEDVLDREVKVVGDKEAVDKVKSIVLKGKVAIQGTEGRYTEYRAANNFYLELIIEGLLTMESGGRGDVAWEKNSITGARLLSNEEKSKEKRDARLQGKGDWRQQYKQVKLVGEEPVAGKPAYKVEMTTAAGQLIISHYDKESGFLVRQESTTETAQSKESVVMFFSDFRKVNGITYPFKIKSVTGPTEVEMTLEKIEHNVEIPDERFALPAEINKLLAKQKK